MKSKVTCILGVVIMTILLIIAVVVTVVFGIANKKKEDLLSISNGTNNTNILSLNSTATTTRTTRTTRTFTTRTTESTTTTTPTTRPGSFSAIYSSSLTNRNKQYCPYGQCYGGLHYYEAILLNITISGVYAFFSQNDVVAHGSLYRRTFHPVYNGIHAITNDFWMDDIEEFSTSADLEANLEAYFLVVSTPIRGLTGEFSISGTGPASPTFTKLNVTLHLEPVVRSDYASALNESSPTISRDYGYEVVLFYYQPVRINVSQTGYYKIDNYEATDVNPSIFTNAFNVSDEYSNRPEFDFWFDQDNNAYPVYYLEGGLEYILVFFAVLPETFPAFRISMEGPGFVIFA